MAASQIFSRFFISIVVAAIDADITLQSVSVQQPDYYVSVHEFQVFFTYVPGVPAATHFSFRSPDGLENLFYTFSPTKPEGQGSQIKSAVLRGNVSHFPSDPDRAYSGRITIHQTDADPELPVVSAVTETNDVENNRITVAWGVPDASALSMALTITEMASLALYETRIQIDDSEPGDWETGAVDAALLQIDDESLADLLQAEGIPEDTRVTVKVEIRPVFEVTNALVPGAYWTGGPNGTTHIYRSGGVLYRTSPYGTDIQTLFSGATLFIEPDGTRIKIPPADVTEALREHGEVSIRTYRWPIDAWRPSAVLTFTAVQYNLGSVRLTWDRPADTGNNVAITGYEIRYKRRSEITYRPENTINVGPTPRQREITGLDQTGTYDFAIRANNGVGYSVTTYTAVTLAPT